MIGVISLFLFIAIPFCGMAYNWVNLHGPLDQAAFNLSHFVPTTLGVAILIFLLMVSIICLHER
jgi:hypothetical protein